MVKELELILTSCSGYITTCLIKDSERDISCAASDVQNLERHLINHFVVIVENLSLFQRTNCINEGVFPDAVDAETHGVVHHIIGIGDTGEDLSDFALFVISINCLESKVDFLTTILLLLS